MSHRQNQNIADVTFDRFLSCSLLTTPAPPQRTSRRWEAPPHLRPPPPTTEWPIRCRPGCSRPTIWTWPPTVRNACSEQTEPEACHWFISISFIFFSWSVTFWPSVCQTSLAVRLSWQNWLSWSRDSTGWREVCPSPTQTWRWGSACRWVLVHRKSRLHRQRNLTF